MLNKNNLLLTFFILILSACGFHLRGYNDTDYKFPFKSVFIRCQGVTVCTNLTNMIKTHDLATIESKEANAEVVISLYNEQTSRDIQGFNAAGRISAYIMTYQFQAQLYKKNIAYGNPMNISVNGVMQYNDATILADTQEEANLWNNLHNNATDQLVRKIVYSSRSNNLSTNSNNTNESE